MQTFLYPASVTAFAPGDFVIRFRDVPEAITGGGDHKAAIAEASDALACAIEGYLKRGWPVPEPSPPQDGEVLIALEPAVAARVILVDAMAKQGLTKVALAARINRDEKVVRRILSGKGASFQVTLDALHALGVWPSLAI